ncbi:hypothetical protein [Nocardia thraciensis]
MAAASGAILQASKVWGGRYFLIVPTDGQSIDEKFWELLEIYSPDYLAVYRLTFADLQHADPISYENAKQRHEKEWKKQDHPAEIFEKWFADSASQSAIDELTLTDDLEEELVYRLSPFHYKGAIDQYVSRASGFGYPFTKIAKIISASSRRVEVVLPKSIGDPTLSLLICSQTGLGDEEYVAELNAEDFPTRQLPDDYSTIDLLRRAFGSSPVVDPTTDGVQEDYMDAVPFSLSMLHLGQYYKSDVHRADEESVTIVLGDTADDFFFYYSLSRLHERVFWLPLAWLRKCNSAIKENIKLRNKGEPTIELGEQEKAARALVNMFFEQIKYGHEDRSMQLCSMSLTDRQLSSYKVQMASSIYIDPERFKSSLNCIPIQSVSVTCVLRVFEQDNYANYRDMIFADGKSVSFLDTPRPKNFSEIKLPGHYWLTSIEIEGYGPPSLATLGPKIVNLHNSTTESRVAVDGIVYLCPNSMIFSSDLDAILRRPKVEMPDVMALFGDYFQPVGVKVEYSDKGNYFLDTLRRFGGLEALGSFVQDPTTRKIFDKFKFRQNAENGNVIFLSNDQRSYLNLGAITASLGNEESAADLVDTLVGKDVLQRGYIFQCQRCLLSSWYGIDVLTTEFVCSRCGYRQQFTQRHWKMPVQPHWYYRLAETVYQFYLNNSDLVAQVLYRLSKESKKSFHFAPEINLVGFPAEGKDSKGREMDVACILDGQIIFGECKTEPLKSDALAKFETLVGMPIKSPARIVFASTKKVSADFRTRASIFPQAEIVTREALYED